MAKAQKDGKAGKLKRAVYEEEIDCLHIELVRLQGYVKSQGLKVVVIFEGRDAAGKGGVIKRITQDMNPRVCRIAALPAPKDRERTQWYFQRYVAQLPAAGEIVLFDRSWYNRAGVERVMGYCTDEEYEEFQARVPAVRGDADPLRNQADQVLVSVSDEEQERRFQARFADPAKHWKLGPMDLEARSRWVDYSRAKDAHVRAHGHRALPGGSSKPTTSAAPSLKRSRTCSQASPTSTWRPARSPSHRARARTATRVHRARRSATYRPCTDGRLIGLGGRRSCA